MAGTLYVVSTPIGNLEDITLRALRILGEVNVIAAEDTRRTQKLLSHFDLHTPLVAYHQHSPAGRIESLVARMADEGQSIALVTDAGTPCLSDPGIEIVAAAIAAGVTVVPLPGASAALAAIVASGLPTARFAFEGFLPRTKASRREKLARFATESRALVFYEAGNRTAETVSDLAAAFGPDRRAVVGRELTKLHEEFLRGGLGDLAARCASAEMRGEVTIIVEGRGEEDGVAPDPDEPEDVETALRRAMAEGLTDRDAVKVVAERLKLAKRDVYAAMLGLKDE